MTDALDPGPQWHALYAPSLRDLSDHDSDGPPALVSSDFKKPSKRLAITNGPAIDSDELPELQSISNSSDESEDEDDSDESDCEGTDSGESGYDEEQEDEWRDMLREAFDVAHEADLFNSVKVEGGIDPFDQDDHKGNPFLKLLGSLRGMSFDKYIRPLIGPDFLLGRMFSSNPRLKITARQSPLRPKSSRPVHAAAPQQRASQTASPTELKLGGELFCRSFNYAS